MNRFWRRTRALAKRAGKIFLALMKKLGRLAWRALQDGFRRLYQFLTSLPPRTLWVGIGAMSLVLVVALVIAIALPGKPSTQTVSGGDRSAQLAATNVPVLPNVTPVPVEPDTPVAPVTADDAEQTGNGTQAQTATEPDTSGGNATAEPTATPFAVLKEGDDGEVIATIQTRLMELGYMDSDEPTEHFGPLTETAIRTFQRHNGLTVDGTVGSQTYTVLMGGDAKQFVMQVGDEGEDVKSVQQRLYELGYITDKGSLTGTSAKRPRRPSRSSRSATSSPATARSAM